jgi:gamma-glutamyl-gamma-aminobutyrate hydrolase PuuD
MSQNRTYLIADGKLLQERNNYKILLLSLCSKKEYPIICVCVCVCVCTLN